MAHDQDEIDKDSLARREDDYSARENEGEEEKEEEEEDSAEDYEKDSDYYRLDRLLQLRERDELPVLNPVSAFIQRVDRGSTLITKEQFKLRLERFFKGEDPNFPTLSSEFTEFLFQEAVDAQRHIATWETIVKNVKSPEFHKARQYLRQELTRYIKIRSLLTQERQEAPSWMLAWEQCWIEVFEEIQENIEAELRSAKDAVDSLSEMRTSGRVEIESFVLWAQKKEIRKQIACTPLARKLEVILAAFAYAAKLVLPKPSEGTDGFVALVKQRISRVSRSKRKHTEAYSFLLRTGLAMQSGESGPKPRT